MVLGVFGMQDIYYYFYYRWRTMIWLFQHWPMVVHPSASLQANALDYCNAALFCVSQPHASNAWLNMRAMRRILAPQGLITLDPLFDKCHCWFVMLCLWCTDALFSPSRPYRRGPVRAAGVSMVENEAQKGENDVMLVYGPWFGEGLQNHERAFWRDI